VRVKVVVAGGATELLGEIGAGGLEVDRFGEFAGAAGGRGT
jgi:hypothetical protein